MVDATYIDNGRIQIVQNNDIAFDTDRPSVTLYPDSSRVIVTDFNLVFPSLIQGRAYYRAELTFGTSYCENWSTLLWQEWGPGESHHNENYYPNNPGGSIPGPTTRNLPREFIGTVPAESNYLDIRAKLHRYVTPPSFGGIEPPIRFFPDDQWINLPGGSCPTEYFDPMIRSFNVVRIGNDLYVERYQSVRNAGSTITATGPGGWPQRNVRVNQSGWNSYNQSTYGSTNGVWSDGTTSNALFPKSNEYLAVMVTQKGPSTGDSKRPQGTNPCLGAYPDLTSRYWMDLVITPGHYKPAT